MRLVIIVSLVNVLTIGKCPPAGPPCSGGPFFPVNPIKTLDGPTRPAARPRS